LVGVGGAFPYFRCRDIAFMRPVPGLVVTMRGDAGAALDSAGIVNYQ